jgi:hypothetical protein
VHITKGLKFSKDPFDVTVIYVGTANISLMVPIDYYLLEHSREDDIGHIHHIATNSRLQEHSKQLKTISSK